ncbi:hypothetical protein Val02_44270 [Virgisporangium aliadipatigenens]|uniref:EF-hand domain-containing protein n=1 Tax=Virgisporangium aliadipatigenens TaxID=741659 RepID=A0A8J3YPH3_9ACTN|nr:DUF4190 domain-containing protein [Virgisporangium aliadipatigenens]GIJ47541.1 hypothetical protein Val02_44270 [Virgisporangium aliadipatigenens]
MARIGLFGRRTEDPRTEELSEPTAVGSARTTTDPADTNRDGVVDRDEARAAHERVEALRAKRERHGTATPPPTPVQDAKVLKDRDRDGIDDRDEVTTTRIATRPAVVQKDRTVVVDRDRDGVDDRDEVAPPPAPAPQKIRARASLIATLALLVGVTSVYAALTGVLAPVAVVLGVIGLILSFGGMSASGKPRIAGGGLALFALILSVGGAVLGVLAMNHTTGWLDSDIDQVARLRDWIDTQLPFMQGW